MVLDFTDGENNTELDCPSCGRSMFCCGQLGDKVVMACNYDDCKIGFIHIFPETEDGYTCQERAYFDRWDICGAYYMYAVNWHEGQYSAIYKIFSKLNDIGFTPHKWFDLSSLTDNGSLIYQSLIKRKHLKGE